MGFKERTIEVVLAKDDSAEQDLDSALKAMSAEEISDVEKEAVAMLDDFNKARFREEGRKAMSAWIMVRNNMVAILDKRKPK